MRVRIRFTKTGNMKYIGHLDVMRYFQKVLRRAEIDVSFSGGFSPHMIMSFAAPLGVGTTSGGEYFDLDLQNAPSGQELMDRMNAQMNEGMSVVSIRKIKEDKASKGMSLVAAADYTISLDLSETAEEAAQNCIRTAMGLPEKTEGFMAQQEINVWRKTKRSEGEVNIRPWIYSFSCEMDENQVPVFHMRVSQGSVSNLKPDLVVKAFAEYAGFEIPQGALRIHREDILANVGPESKPKLISMGRLGEEIE
ncbi:MAG: TIGR03936 family radical SAM-associated protein [Lachnospiraceae bacterium]|nr:TIGR03936 family radical SAM-associated protein [Lachnospiraceae bacterium]